MTAEGGSFGNSMTPEVPSCESGGQESGNTSAGGGFAKLDETHFEQTVCCLVKEWTSAEYFSVDVPFSSITRADGDVGWSFVFVILEKQSEQSSVKNFFVGRQVQPTPASAAASS